MLNNKQAIDSLLDMQLGLIKLGLLLASEHPDKINAMINCGSVADIAKVVDISSDEKLFDSAMALLNRWCGRNREWLEDNGGA